MDIITSHFSIALTFFILLLSSLPSPLFSNRCHPDDYKALIKIKKSLNNPRFLDFWDHNTDCCNWTVAEFYNICDEKTNRVRHFELSDRALSSQIPSAIGDLPYLENIIFRNLTNITGSIPKSITKLKHLTLLWLSSLELSGPIPQFLSKLITLVYLNLSDNKFSGSIPPSLSKLKNLGPLYLERNRLTGSIPESFGHFNGITPPQLYLSHNQLDGSIPKSLGDMNFLRIDLSRNKLVGDASMLFNPDMSTYEIDISWNLFDFDLSTVKFQRGLDILDLSHNRIRGSIPKQLGEQVFPMYLFNVSYNRLCGEIPTQSNTRSGFDKSAYVHNRCLCGPLLKAKCK
ncbi:hypothetical protein GIB67_003224 [Kingdonia uniflora]|uniref:Leucine-rich repeat-containing N-terminal plant-type domain-containing protein n=1 Tax=Kingdonia uniflora TaxID=39325 RepID=A0A7J7LGV2_9MAGN|nr:hypothetical protein GIB67_003224 [Kingdonia uniflora]